MEKVSIKQASKELGMNENAVRIRMERNLFKPAIGYVMPSIRGNRKQYYIYREQLNNYLKGGN